MDINKLMHFRCTYESKSMRRASEILGISAGALSKSLRIFQEELGVKLIEPEGRGVVFTKEGNDFYKNSNRLLAELDFLKKSLNQEIKSEFKLGTYEVFSTHFLSSFINVEKVQNIHCKELAPREIEISLVEHQIDYGLTLIPFPHDELEHLKIGSANMKLFCHSSLVNMDIKQLNFAVPITELVTNPLQTLAIDHWPQNIQRNIKYKFHQLETALLLASVGECVIYVPDFCVKLFNSERLSKYQLKEHSFKRANKKIDIYLVKRKEFSEDQFIKKIAKFVRTSL